MSDKTSRRRLKALPVICEQCGGGPVHVLRSQERVLIRCEACGAKIFAHYADPHQRGDDEEAGPLVRSVELELLSQVTIPAQALYEYLRRYVGRHGYAPTLREMQAGMGWSSVNVARHYLKQLEKAGLIERDFAATRGIRIVYVA
jgi:hypothetical protein